MQTGIHARLRERDLPGDTFSLSPDTYDSFSCFTFVPLEIFYAFVIPNWLLLTIAGLKSMLGNLACDKTTEEQDRLQCYWAK